MTGSEPKTRRLGYVRVSAYGETLVAQLEQLKADGCIKIYRENASGAKADRQQLLRTPGTIAPGDLATWRR